MAPKSSVSEIDSALAAAHLFRALSDDQRTQLVAASRVRPLAAGEVLWRYGADAEYLAVLLQGRVKILGGGSQGEELPPISPHSW